MDSDTFLAKMIDKTDLVLMIVVDGGRGDFIDAFDTPNFHSLIQQGVRFRNAVACQAFVETASGMATISTGSYIRTHGVMASHEWYSIKERRTVYSVDEYGRANNLLVFTFGDLLKIKHPNVKLASVSSKDRNAILLAGHSADLIVYSYREFPDAFSFKGAGVLTDHYTFAERKMKPLPRYLQGYQLPRFVEWSGESFSHSQIEAAQTPLMDRFITDAALEVLKKEKPDILCVGLVSPNIVGHYYPSDSGEMEDTIRTVDAQIGRMLSQLEKMGILERTLIVVTSDHGMTRLRGVVRFPSLLRGKLTERLSKEVAHILLGSTVGVYLRSQNPREMNIVLDAVKSIDHLAGAWLKDDPDAPWFIRRVACPHAPQIIAVAEYGYTFLEEFDSNLYGYHGAPYPSDASIMLILKGPNIRPLGNVGEPLDLNSSELMSENQISTLPQQVDIAPTIEHLFELTSSHRDGSSLFRFLK
jgi:hypothetical protein